MEIHDTSHARKHVYHDLICSVKKLSVCRHELSFLSLTQRTIRKTHGTGTCNDIKRSAGLIAPAASKLAEGTVFDIVLSPGRL